MPRNSGRILGVAILLASAANGYTVARAAQPDPSNCIIDVSPPSQPCHYVFAVDGNRDEMSVFIELNDVNGDPVLGYWVRGTIASAGASTLALCVCAPCGQLVAPTINNNRILRFSKIGGRGELKIVVEALDDPISPTIVVPIGEKVVTFTSYDLNGSCQNHPLSSVDVVDLGIFAGGFPPGYNANSDYNCSGPPVGVVDLGIWAYGLARGCDGSIPCE